jgi:hypothetical protein
MCRNVDYNENNYNYNNTSSSYFYGCEICSPTPKKEHGLSVQSVFEPKRRKS